VPTYISARPLDPAEAAMDLFENAILELGAGYGCT
jgi:hypothetical protein